MSKFPQNHTVNFSKINWRAGNIAGWRYITGLRQIPKGSCMVTLGGPCANGDGSVIPYSEYDQVVLQEGLCSPEQYVSIEGRDRETHKHNTALKNSTWLWGDFAEQFAEFYTSGRQVSFVSADLMSGIDDLIPTLDIVFEIVKEQQKKNAVSLTIFNVLERCLFTENKGGKKYSNLWDKVKSDKFLTKSRKGFERVGHSGYWSGERLASSKLAQLAFVYRT